MQTNTQMVMKAKWWGKKTPTPSGLLEVDGLQAYPLNGGSVCLEGLTQRPQRGVKIWTLPTPGTCNPDPLIFVVLQTSKMERTDRKGSYI